MKLVKTPNILGKDFWTLILDSSSFYYNELGYDDKLEVFIGHIPNVDPGVIPYKDFINCNHELDLKLLNKGVPTAGILLVQDVFIAPDKVLMKSNIESAILDDNRMIMPVPVEDIGAITGGRDKIRDLADIFSEEDEKNLLERYFWKLKNTSSDDFYRKVEENIICDKFDRRFIVKHLYHCVLYRNIILNLIKGYVFY